MARKRVRWLAMQTPAVRQFMRPPSKLDVLITGNAGAVLDALDRATASLKRLGYLVS